MDKDDSFGTPQVVGVENLSTQYREDKRLRVHETPFELRCPVLKNTFSPIRPVAVSRIGDSCRHLGDDKGVLGGRHT